MQLQLFCTWDEVSENLAEADRASGRSGYGRHMRMLRRESEALGLEPRDLEEPGAFEDLADAAGWSHRSEVILRKVAGYAGIDVDRHPTPGPDDLDPAVTAALRRPATPPASPPEVRNTCLAALVWHWPASSDVIRVLDPAQVTVDGDDLVIQLNRTEPRRLTGIAAPYKAWLDTRANLGWAVRTSPIVFCQTPSPVKKGVRPGEQYSDRGLRKSWTTHCQTRLPRLIVPFATYRRLALETGAPPVDLPDPPSSETRLTA